MKKKIYIAADHAGYAHKKAFLRAFEDFVDWQDLGAESEESCDYPLFAEKVCLRLQKEPQALGLLICGTGVGMSMAANKFKGIRAAGVSDPVSAQMAREHNNAQVLCLGARIIDVDRAKECFESFLNSKFDSNHPRHQRRIDQIERIYDNGHCGET